jgi:hypothetical protein
MGWFHEALHTNKKIEKKRETKYKSKFMKVKIARAGWMKFT